MSYHVAVASLLIDLEAVLRQRHHWQAEPLDPAALQSSEPFAVDTMTLAQWLQFIFIPRLRLLNEAGQRLPGRCEIVPIAEQYFSLEADREVVAVIARLDELLNRPSA